MKNKETTATEITDCYLFRKCDDDEKDIPTEDIREMDEYDTFSDKVRKFEWTCFFILVTSMIFAFMETNDIRDSFSISKIMIGIVICCIISMLTGEVIRIRKLLELYYKENRK